MTSRISIIPTKCREAASSAWLLLSVPHAIESSLPHRGELSHGLWRHLVPQFTAAECWLEYMRANYSRWTGGDALKKSHLCLFRRRRPCRGRRPFLCRLRRLGRGPPLWRACRRSPLLCLFPSRGQRRAASYLADGTRQTKGNRAGQSLWFNCSWPPPSWPSGTPSFFRVMGQPKKRLTLYRSLWWGETR